MSLNLNDFPRFRLCTPPRGFVVEAFGVLDDLIGLTIEARTIPNLRLNPAQPTCNPTKNVFAQIIVVVDPAIMQIQNGHSPIYRAELQA